MGSDPSVGAALRWILQEHGSSMQLDGIRTFWAQNIRQENLTKFTKILKYIKLSCIFFFSKMFRYSHYIHFLQEKSTHFGLRVLTKLGLCVSRHLGVRKSNKTHKGLNYIKSSHIIFSAKISRYSHYIYFLQEEWTYFYLRALKNFGLRKLGHFGPQNLRLLVILKTSNKVFEVMFFDM